MAVVDEPDLLETCPWCGYLLQGLPIEHRCPECGQPVDRRWEVFGGLSRWRSLGTWQRVGTLFLIALGLLGLGLPWLGRFGFWSPLSYVLVPVLLAFAAGAYWSELSTPAMFLGVGPNGISAASRRRKTLETYAWESIGRIEFFGESDLTFEFDGRPRRFKAWRGNQAEAKRFAECVMKHVYGSLVVPGLDDGSASDPIPPDDVLLDACPWCGYCLRGLPVRCRCSKCGRPVDRRWEIFGGVARWSSLSAARRVSTIAMLVAALLAPLVAWLVFGSMWLVVAGLVFAAVMLRGVFLAPPVFLGVGPGGIVAGHRRGRSIEIYPWKRTSSVSDDAPRTAAVIIDGRPRTFNAWRGNVAEAERFVEHVLECRYDSVKSSAERECHAEQEDRSGGR
jgi:hypothetical protein